jgi:hypothetical protein
MSTFRKVLTRAPIIGPINRIKNGTMKTLRSSHIGRSCKTNSSYVDSEDCVACRNSVHRLSLI